jgi:predicted permease
MKNPRPPRLAEWLVRVAAGDDEAEHVLGDLREEYSARADSRGPDTWYWRQAIRSVVPLLHARWISRHAQPILRPDDMESLKSDFSYALRGLLRRPVFTIVAVMTLALGIGTATAIFTIVDGVLLKPLPFARAGRIVTIWQTDTTWRHQATLRDRWDRLWFTYPEYQQWSAAQRSFSAIALYGDQQMSMTGAGDPAQVSVATATPNLMSVLGTRVALGRWFLPNEVGTGTERLAVISFELWQTRFGGDSALIGKSIALDDNAFRVVGVLPSGFTLNSLTSTSRTTASVWIPLGSDGGGQRFDSSYEAIGLLSAGVPLDAAAVEIDRLARAASGRAERGARLVPRLEAETAAARRPLALLSAGVAVLLLMACVNVGMLLLGEAPAREMEIATRRALGASTSRIVRQLLTESVVLAALGGMAGVFVAYVGVRLLVAGAPPGMPRMDNVAINVAALAFCAVAVLGTAVAFGLVPAVAASSTDANESLRTRTGQVGRRQKRLHGIAISLQVALALVLLVGATVLTRSLRNLNAVDSGVRTDDVLTLSVTLPSARYATPASVLQYFDALDARLAALPGVRAVGATSSLPFSGRNQTTSVEIEGTAVPSDAKPNVQRRVVRPGYFEAMGIPLRAGRLYERRESSDSAAVVIDETMAERLWPNQSPLGKRVKAFGGWLTVIGVVGSVYHGRLDEPPRPTFYLPHWRQAARQMTIVLRVDGDPLAHAADVRRALWSVDGTIPMAGLSTMASRVSTSLSNETYRTALLDVFGAAAALLTGVGVFGVTARGVSQRRRELGIRIALGAATSAVVRVVLREQMLSIAAGLAAGLIAAVAAGPLLRGFAFGTSPTDILTMLVACAGLIVTSVCAALPAVRAATRIDPAAVIRDA